MNRKDKKYIHYKQYLGPVIFTSVAFADNFSERPPSSSPKEDKEFGGFFINYEKSLYSYRIANSVAEPYNCFELDREPEGKMMRL
jgi:hypothetical protein